MFWMLKTATIVDRGHRSCTLLNLLGSFFHSPAFWKRSFNTPCYYYYKNMSVYSHWNQMEQLSLATVKYRVKKTLCGLIFLSLLQRDESLNTPTCYICEDEVIKLNFLILIVIFQEWNKIIDWLNDSVMHGHRFLLSWVKYTLVVRSF